jgi:hypothetical protein
VQLIKILLKILGSFLRNLEVQTTQKDPKRCAFANAHPTAGNLRALSSTDRSAIRAPYDDAAVEPDDSSGGRAPHGQSHSSVRFPPAVVHTARVRSMARAPVRGRVGRCWRIGGIAASIRGSATRSQRRRAP